MQQATPQVEKVCFINFHFFVIHVVQAITRLTPREYYDRSYRLKRACQASVLHAPLPKEQWTKPEDVSLLWNIPLPFNLSISTGRQIPLASCRGRLEGGSRETDVGQPGCRTKMNGQLLDFLI